MKDTGQSGTGSNRANAGHSEELPSRSAQRADRAREDLEVPSAPGETHRGQAGRSSGADAELESTGQSQSDRAAGSSR